MARSARRTLAVLAAVSLLLVVVPAPAGAAAEQQVLVRFRPAGRVYETDVRIVRAPARSAGALARALASSRLVDYAEPDADYRIFLSEPNDPRFAQQYAHQRIQSVAGWEVYPGAYTPSGGATIAMIDTGAATGHEDLAGRIDAASSACFLGLLCLLGGYDDTVGHGTHVAGIAGAATNNGKGVAGVAFNSPLMILKACDALGSCQLSAIASAINWARTRGARVVSMSLGGTDSSRTLEDAVKAAHQAGVVLVAAAGNEGDATLNFPAAYAEVISVGATDAADERASFSNANADVELAAPGVGILSTYTSTLPLLGGLPLLIGSGGYATLSGTSMATPHAAGLAALLLGQNPAMTGEQVRARMAACADDLGPPGRDPGFGFGRINVARALGGEC